VSEWTKERTGPVHPRRRPVKGGRKEYATQRARQERLKAAGLCVNCGAEKATRGQQCQPCYEKHRAIAFARRMRLRAAARCTNCGKGRAVKAGTCAKCYKARRKAQAERAARYQREGRCVICGKPRGEDGTSLRCRKHADSTNESRAKIVARHRERGLCINCGKKANGGPLCAKCRKRCSERALARITRLVAEGNCQQCAKPRGEDGTGRYCRPCADYHTAKQMEYMRRTGRAR